jgi:uncharacterized metal-binding protein YceD (DUF177 family)
MSNDLQNEFSRPIPLDRIASSWATHVIEAGPEERAALAARFEILAIESLTAEVRLRRDRAGVQVAFSARFSASVIQECVFTLEPTPTKINEAVEIRFDLSPEILAAELDIEAGDDSAEPLEGDVLDIGEVIAQHLSLALDPFPRHSSAPPPPDAEDLLVAEIGLPETEVEATPETGRPSPFAALAKIRGVS